MKKYILSTDPRADATHWRQTIIAIPKPIPVQLGDVLYGSIALRKNPFASTDVDIKVSYHYRGKNGTYNDI